MKKKFPVFLFFQHSKNLRKIKRRTVLNLLFVFILGFNVSEATQSIQIQSQLSELSPSGELIFLVKNLDQGSIKAESLKLMPGKNLETFEVSDTYQIIQWSLQAPYHVFTPCESTPIIHQRSLLVTITGALTQEELQCSFHTTTALPKLYLPKESLTSATKSGETNDPQAGYQEIAKYLMALQKCTPGDFHAVFPGQIANYKILGRSSGACDVTISADSKRQPLTCHFTDNDIALLTTSSTINGYQTGNITPAANSLNTNIMNARCSSGQGGQ